MKIFPFYLICVCLTLAIPLSAQSIKTEKAEDVGMSTERLGRLAEKMELYVSEEKIAGAITLVARQGKVIHFKKYGHADQENNNFPA